MKTGVINVFTTSTAQQSTAFLHYKTTSWGKPRNPNTWQASENVVFKATARGYTLHEHIALFDIINMNGRLYDAKLGRMLSPDNYIQAPTSTQSYNRYSYAFNNPLKYVDPDGNWAISGQNATHNRSRMGTAGWNMVWRDFTEGGDPAMAEITRQNMYQGAYIGKDYENMDDMVKDAWDATPAGTDLGYTYSYGSLTGTYIPDASRRTLPTNWGQYIASKKQTPANNKRHSTSSLIQLIRNISKSSKYKLNFSGAEMLEEDAQSGEAFTKNNATKQFIAIVAGESGNNIDEAAAIGSVILNRLEYKNGTISNGFLNKIGGASQFDAIGGRIYNLIMKSSWSDILTPLNPYANRITGAIMSLSGFDYSYGAYFWNASSPKKGFNWKMYYNGTYIITREIGGTTFFKYSNPKSIWP